jgi:Domain of unknown function (DUF4279)
MTTKPQICVELKLTGIGFSPEDLTKVIPLAPTATWRLGDYVQDSKLTRKHDGWQFGFPYRDTYDMDDLLRELLDLIEPYKASIAEATNRFSLQKEISFGVYIRDEAPASWFSADTINRVAAFGASLDIDLLLLG